MDLKLSVPINHEQRFWEWFSKNADTYFDFPKNKEALFERLQSELGKVHSKLVFQFSSILDDGKREFVISADGNKKIFPVVQRLVDSAPVLDKWNIIAFRQPHEDLTVIQFLETRVNVDDIFFRYHKSNGKINIELNCRGYFESTEWTGIAFILLDSLLGEYHTEMSIGFIDKKELNEEEVDELFPIRDLPKIVEEYHLELHN